MSPASEVGKVRSFIREHVSPTVGRAGGRLLLGRGANRGSLLTGLRSATLPPLRQAEIIRTLETEKIIKTRFHGKFQSLSEVEEFHLTLALTPEKIEGLKETLFFTNEVLLPAAFAPFEAAADGAGLPSRALDKVTDLIWGIRESHYSAQCQMVRIRKFTALMAHLTQEISKQEVDDKAITAETRHSLEVFLSQAPELAEAMKTDFNALLKRWNGRISIKEKAVYLKAQELLNHLDAADASQKLLETLREFRTLPEVDRRSMRHLARVLDSLIEVAELSDKIANTNAGDEKQQLAADLEVSSRKTLNNINQMLKHGDIKNWPLRFWAASAIGFSLFYIGYRIFDGFILPWGQYTLPSLFASLALIMSEAFCIYSSVINNLGVLHALVKTKGAHGQSWLAKARTKLPDDPFKRPAAALFLANFNEPVQIFLGSTKAGVRAVWAYGNASLKVLDNSAFALHFHFGLQSALRWVRRMSVVKEALTQLAEQSGVADKIKCHEISTDLASRETELDNVETARFAILRAVQDTARNHQVYEKKVIKLATAVLKACRKTNETLSKSVVTEGRILELALKLKIDPDKAVSIALESHNKIVSLQRKSDIAALARKILDEETTTPQDRFDLADLLVKEHGIDRAAADRLVETMIANAHDLYTLSRYLTDEIELFDTPQKRGIFYQAYDLMEKVMRFDEREANIEVHLNNKCRQIVAFVTGLRDSPARFSRAAEMGDEIAAFVAGQPLTIVRIEELLHCNPGITYEQADNIAWKEKSIAIKNRILELAGKYHVNEELREALADKILEELSLNREERFASTFGICQYLAQKLFLDYRTPEQAVNALEAEKKYLSGMPRRNPVNPIWMKQGLLEIAQELYDLKFSPKKVDPPSLTLDHQLIRQRVGEYVDLVHRDQVLLKGLFGKENSGKAGIINNAIHGFTRDEMIAEMLRQTIHKQVKEKYFGEVHIPEEIETYLDQNVSDLVPDELSSSANPRHLGHRLLALIKITGTPEKACEVMLDELGLTNSEKARKHILLMAQEMQARMILYQNLLALANDPNAALQGLEQVCSHERRYVQSLIEKVKKSRKAFSVILRPDAASGFSLAANDDLPKNSEHRLLVEEIQHFAIAPEGRTTTEIIDHMIAVRRLPREMLRYKKGKIEHDPKQAIAPELKSYAEQIEALFANHQNKISVCQTPEEAAEMLIKLAEKEVLYSAARKDRNKGTVYSPFEQMRPQMSGLKYKVIGAFDADYRINPEALHEVVPYFTDHPPYFFIGKRQYGRNWPDNHMARVMQNAQDGFWGFQNIASSLAPNTASWGSCVFHTTESYMDSSKWIEQRSYREWLWDKGISKDGKLFGLLKVPGNFKWYQLYDRTQKDNRGRVVGGWTPARRFTPLRVVNALQRLTEILLGIENNRWARRAVSLPFTALKAGVFPLHALYVLLASPARNTLHERAIRGKFPYFGARKSDGVLDMLASQDFSTESEDIASCMWDLRAMPFLTGGRHPLLRSGFIEGLGGLGSHAEDFRAYRATDLTRWRRGNLDLLPEINDTPMTLWAKMRYKLLAQNWTLGLLRLSFMAMPPAFAFLGVDPIITSDPPQGLLTLGALAFTNFFVNIGAFFANMSSRGHGPGDAVRAMLIDYYFLNAKLGSVIDGRFIRERSAFLISAKKIVVALKCKFGERLSDHAIAMVNLFAAGYATWFGIQTLEPDVLANAPKFFVPFWSLFNFGFIEAANLYMNRGVRQNSAAEDERTFDPTLPSEEGGGNK